jgi:hypothetical protein
VDAFRTSPASRYLKSRGVPASKSYLEKVRTRGDDDPRDKGPDYWTDEQGFCWYPREALDRYAEQRLAARTLRGRNPQPENFRPRITRREAGPKRASRRSARAA